MSEHRIGSDIGWTIFGLGMLVLLAGGCSRRPLFYVRPAPAGSPSSPRPWGSACSRETSSGLATAFLSVPVLALYAGAWLWFGRLLLAQGPSTG